MLPMNADPPARPTTTPQQPPLPELPDLPDLRLAVVAETPLVLAGLRASLAGRADCRIVASAASLPALARALAAEAEGKGTGVDVLVVDAGEPPAASRSLLADDDAAPRACVLLTDAGAPPLQRWLRAGISVLPRAAQPAQIVAAARAAAAGLVALPPEWLAAHVPPLPPAPDLLALLVEPLSARERQVLGKMADGLGNRQIAQVLEISEHTAKFHVAQILGKLQAASRTEAVVKGLRHGLIAAVPPGATAGAQAGARERRLVPA
jgi:DNA-binding NarL/FixJ family response regulator